MTYTGPIDESTLNDALQQPLSNIAQAIRDPRKQPTQEAGPAELGPGSPYSHGSAQQRNPSAASTASSVIDLGEDSDDASWMSRSPMLRHKIGSPSLTPMMLPSGSVSAVSGSSSPRGSFGTSLLGETDSQGLSAGEEMEPVASTVLTSSSVQLVMPSIKMPSRRPFTEKGKQMFLSKMASSPTLLLLRPFTSPNSDHHSGNGFVLANISEIYLVAWPCLEEVTLAGPRLVDCRLRTCDGGGIGST